MPTKGRDISVKEKRGRSPFPRKQAMASTESRKIPIYDKHTVSSSLYARSHIKQPSVDSTKLVPQSRVMSLKSKFNEKKFTNLSMNTTGLTKTKDVRKPDIVREIFHGKKQTSQLTKLFDDHNIATREEDDVKCIDREDDDTLKCEVQSQDDADASICLREDPNLAESNTCEDGITTFDERISIEHTATKQMSIVDSSNDQHPHFEVDQEVDYEQGVEVGSKDVEQDRSKGLGPREWRDEEPEPNEVEEVPKEEQRLKVVVAYGKKETAAYNYVMEEAQRWNRVKALVGAFEILISLECNALQNNYQRH